ncbi:Non-specific lipid-transfer protein [Psidium guajava]|nr:Non-specific lipid-transfer protein [Psidium guajava]
MRPLSFAVLALFVALFLLSTRVPVSESAVSCSDVLKDLKPCVSYLKSGSGMPPAACCAGVSALANVATSSADKKAACACIKNAAQKMNPNAQLAQALPGNCKITLPVAVSANVDCSKVG